MSKETAKAFRALSRGLKNKIRWGFDYTNGSSEADTAKTEAMEAVADEADSIADLIENGKDLDKYAK